MTLSSLNKITSCSPANGEYCEEIIKVWKYECSLLCSIAGRNNTEMPGDTVILMCGRLHCPLSKLWELLCNTGVLAINIASGAGRPFLAGTRQITWGRKSNAHSCTHRMTKSDIATCGQTGCDVLLKNVNTADLLM